MLSLSPVVKVEPKLVRGQQTSYREEPPCSSLVGGEPMCVTLTAQ